MTVDREELGLVDLDTGAGHSNVPTISFSLTLFCAHLFA